MRSSNADVECWTGLVGPCGSAGLAFDEGEGVGARAEAQKIGSGDDLVASLMDLEDFVDPLRNAEG
jgi:hypothetical protein